MMRLYSIRTRTVLVLLSIGLLVVLVLGGLWVYSTYGMMKNDIRVSNLQDARLISSYVGSFTHDIVADEIVAAGNPDTIEIIERNDSEHLKLIGDSLASTIQGSALVVIVDNESNVLYHSRGANTTEFVTSGWYDAALKKNGSYVTGLYYCDILKDYVFSVSTPVMDRGSVIGYIIASVQPEMLDQAIQKQRLNPDRNIIVVDNHGLVVSHDNKTYVEKNTNFSYVQAVQYLMNGTEGVIETSQTYDGKPRIVGFSPVPISGWGVIVSTPMNIVYSQIFRRILEILALLAGLSLLIMAISFFISRYLTKPIVELSDNMRMISAGKYRTRARAERKDEIGDLARAFNSMMDELERTGELERTVELSKKYRLIFLRAKDPILFADIDGKILDVNEAACKDYGYTRDEMLSMTAEDLRIPEERPKLRATLKNCFEEGCVYETVHVKKDGITFPVEISSAGASIGNRPLIVSVIRDITERKKAEQELERLNDQLRRTNQELSAIIDITTRATATLDLDKLLDGVLKRLNDVMHANASVILLKEDHVIRVYASVGVEEEAKARYSMPVGNGFAGIIAQTKKPLYVEDAQTNPLVISPIIKKSGIRSMLGVPLIVDRNVIGVIHIDWLDLHPFNEKDQELLQVIANRCASAILNARLHDETVKLQHQAQLYLDLMGHDINNMNQVAIGYLELALESLDLDTEQKKFIEKPLEALQSSSKLIENVGKLQKAKRGEFPSKIVDLCDVLKQLKDQYSHMPERKVTINFVPAPECSVAANELIRDVFSNLIGNAIKHSDPVKPLTINIGMEKVIIDNKDYFRVGVEDNGPGISDEVKPMLFMRFKRGDTKASGKGLGLYIVKTLVEDFHGKVWVEDRVPGDHTKGARFIVLLPAVEM